MSEAAERIGDDIKRCGNCQWWTHEHGAVGYCEWEDGFALCGKTHVITLYSIEAHVNIVTYNNMKGCQEWRMDLPVPYMSDEEVQDLIAGHDLADTEEDDVTDEEWKVLVAND